MLIGGTSEKTYYILTGKCSKGKKGGKRKEQPNLPENAKSKEYETKLKESKKKQS